MTLKEVVCEYRENRYGISEITSDANGAHQEDNFFYFHSLTLLLETYFRPLRHYFIL